jgi:hypothetical protein
MKAGQAGREREARMISKTMMKATRRKPNKTPFFVNILSMYPYRILNVLRKKNKEFNRICQAERKDAE